MTCCYTALTPSDSSDLRIQQNSGKNILFKFCFIVVVPMQFVQFLPSFNAPTALICVGNTPSPAVSIINPHKLTPDDSCCDKAISQHIIMLTNDTMMSNGKNPVIKLNNKKCQARFKTGQQQNYFYEKIRHSF